MFGYSEEKPEINCDHGTITIFYKKNF